MDKEIQERLKQSRLEEPPEVSENSKPLRAELNERLRRSREEVAPEVSVEQPISERQVVLDRIRRDKELQANDQGRRGGRGVPEPVVHESGDMPDEEV